jgi:hypothetical protein
MKQRSTQVANDLKWSKVASAPERWERTGVDAIEASEDGWSVLPSCGHRYTAVSLETARQQSAERGGLCTDCWLGRHLKADAPPLP